MRKLLAFSLSLGATMLLVAGGHVALTLLFVSVVLPRSERFPLELYAASYLVLGWGACWFLRLVRNALSLTSG